MINTAKTTRWTLRALMASTALLALPVGAPAVEDEELILEAPRPRIQVAPRATPARRTTPTPSIQAKPTPRPEEVIVGIVNSRAITRAELDARVTSQYDRLRREVQSRFGGVVSTIDPEFRELVLNLDGEENEVLAEQKDLIDKAMREEESAALQAWVEHSMLSDEARRHGIVISEPEFRRRLSSAEQTSDLDQDTLSNLLSRVNVSRSEYEKGVYDALMIERLVERFVQVNYTEAQFRAAFQANPAVFYEPPRYQLAHFAIALDSADSRSISDRRSLANRVRERLRSAEDPQDIFDLPEFNNQLGGFGGIITGYLTLDENILPPVVQVRARRLRVGEVSDVLLNQAREGGQVVVRSIHVVKLLDQTPETGTTFETALPAIRRSMTEIARTQLLERLREAGTHRVITNLGGIPAHRIPSPEETRSREANAQPISLVMPRG